MVVLCEKDIMEALIIKLLVLIKNEEVNKEKEIISFFMDKFYNI